MKEIDKMLSIPLNSSIDQRQSAATSASIPFHLESLHLLVQKEMNDENFQDLLSPTVLKARLENVLRHVNKVETKFEHAALVKELGKLFGRVQKFSKQLSMMDHHIILNDAFRKNFYAEFSDLNLSIRNIAIRLQSLSDCQLEMHRREDLEVRSFLFHRSSFIISFHRSSQNF